MTWAFWRSQRTHQRPDRGQRWRRPFLEVLESRLVLSTSSLDLVTFSGAGYDFNHDGNADVLTYDRQTGNVFVDLMNGQGQAYGPQQGLGTFFVAQNTNPQLQMAGAGNWLGANDTDILWENTSTDQPVIWKMQGLQFTGTAVTLPYTIDTNSRIIGEADFDHNGTADLLLENDATHSLTMWLMNGEQRVGVVSIAQALPASSVAVAMGDINGDQTPDILIENASTKELTAWLMDPAITGNHASVDGTVDMGSIADPTYDYRVGGVTELHNNTPGILSDILLRAMNGVDQANFVDRQVTGMGPPATFPDATIYTRAPIHQAFITADAIASLPLTSAEQSHNLVPIVPDNPQLQWKVINGIPYVLLSTWENYPNPSTQFDATWTTIPSQLQSWYQTNASSPDAISADVWPNGTGFYQRAYQRTTQLLGLPNDQGHNYFAELWVPVSATNIWRPAPDPNYTTTDSPLTPPSTFQDANYPPWYNTQLNHVSYIPPPEGQWPGGYPWTRLGYTYDWANPPVPDRNPGLPTNEGLSEYVIPQNTSVIINDVISNEVYWDRLYGRDLTATAGQPITYIDAAGNTVTVTLTGDGQVEVVLPTKSGNANAVAINTTGTNLDSSLSIAVSGGKTTVVNEINIGTFGTSASLGSLEAPGVDLAARNMTTTQGITGEFNIHGAIGNVVMHNLLGQNNLVIYGDNSSTPASLQFNQVINATLTATTPIQSLQAAQWQTSSTSRPTNYTIQAPWIGSLDVAGNFTAAVRLSGQAGHTTLGSLHVGGNMTNSLWNITGDVRQFQVDGTVSGNSSASTVLAASGSIGILRLGASDTSNFLAGVDPNAFANVKSTTNPSFPTTAASFINPQAGIGNIAIVGWDVPPGQTVPVLLRKSNFSAPNFGSVLLQNASNVQNAVGQQVTPTYVLHVLGSADHIQQAQYIDTSDASYNWSWQPGQAWPGPAGSLDVIPLTPMPPPTPPAPPSPPTPPPPTPPTPEKSVSTQLLLSALMEPQLATPQGWDAMQQQLALWLAFGLRSSPQEAVSLVLQEATLVLDLVAAANLTARGVNSAGLTASFESLSASIAANPFYNTTAGYQVAMMTGAMTLHALTSS